MTGAVQAAPTGAVVHRAIHTGSGVDYLHDDGGRAAAGYKGTTRDCACRAIAIATGRPYQEVYDLIIDYGKRERKSSRKSGRSHPRTGVYGATMDRMLRREFRAAWTPTMTIGSGTTVHVRADELPSTGAHVLRLSKHFSAYVDGVPSTTRTTRPATGRARCTATGRCRCSARAARGT